MMSVRSDAFVKRWVTENVHTVPGLTDLHGEMVRLAAKLFTDAGAVGITGKELADSVGDVREFLADAYENVHDRGAVWLH
jgi:hypothetical protein